MVVDVPVGKVSCFAVKVVGPLDVSNSNGVVNCQSVIFENVGLQNFKESVGGH